MPRGGQNRLPVRVKQSYFELIRTGMPGAEAARRVDVSMSCDLPPRPWRHQL